MVSYFELTVELHDFDDNKEFMQTSTAKSILLTLKRMSVVCGSQTLLGSLVC